MDKSARGEKSITSATESSQPAATHSFWPKVILWVIVILVGFMFVRSLAKKDTAEEQTETAVPMVEQQAAAPAAATEEKAAPEALAEPESGAPADKAAEVAPAAEKVEAASPAKPEPGVADKAPKPASPGPAAPALATTETAPAAPPVAAASAPTPAAPAPAASQQTGPAAPSAGSRQIQLMAEYEAKRKAAQEESRRMYYERMRQPKRAPWGSGQRQRPYYGNPYQPWGSN